MFFLRKSSLEPLPVVMSGVRMGERALQIGVDESALVGAIAAKVGLSGQAAVVAGEERQAARARAAAARAGALADVQVAPLDALPFADGSFDVVVVHAGGVRREPGGAPEVGALREAARVLREGGRLVVIHRVAPGLMARFRGSSPAAADSGTTRSALEAAGFRASRLLAEREGYRFFEGLKHELTLG